METPIAIGAALLMLGVGVLGILIFGIKNVVTGKHELQKILSLLVPFVIFGISYGVTGELIDAAMLTMLIMIGIMLLLIVFNGIRGVFS